MDQNQILHENLKKHFGFDAFRPLQEEIVRTVLSGRDCLVVMPTGSGKSICYQLPAVVSEGTFVVVSPLIALMKDQVEALKANGIAAGFVNSSLEFHEERAILSDLQGGKLKLLYLSPEKLLSGPMHEQLKALKISGFAIDEAHCISVWGHDFREEYSKLNFIKTKWPGVPVIALTATADKVTRLDIVKQLGLKNARIFISSFNRPNLSLRLAPGQRVYQQVKEIVDRHRGRPGIIYCLSRKTCEEVAARLTLDGHNAAHYHAGMDRKERARVQEDFIKDNVPVIVATIAFGMGIDKSNIRFVIHYNMPKNIEGYYQEIGRGGRDGLPCETVMFYSYRDVMVLRGFAEESGQKEIQLAKLRRMQQYAEASVCRRRILLSYFGEDLKEDCGNCDVCENPPAVFDATVIVQKALSALKRLKENVGMGTLIDVLRGSQKGYIFEKGYHEIKTFGAGSDLSYADWQHYLLQMLHHGFIEIAYDRHHILKVTQAGGEVLFENRKVQFVQPTERGDKPVYLKPERKKTKKQLLEDGLFETLRELRKMIADSKGVPPYVVFSDATLQEMAGERPFTLDDMSLIAGVGEYKLKEYGQVFIDRIIDYLANSDASGAQVRGISYLKTWKLLKEGRTVAEIAKERNIQDVTVYSHLAYLYEKNMISSIEQWISDEEIAKIREAVAATGAPHELKPIFQRLGGAMHYGKIRLALSYLKINDQLLS